jgi:integrase
MVTHKVAKLVDAPRVPRHEISPLTPDEAKQLFEGATDDRYRGLWITAIGTGMRQGELLALRWADVDLDANRLHVRHTLARVNGKLELLEPKTNRTVPLAFLCALDVAVNVAVKQRLQSRSRRIGGRLHAWNLVSPVGFEPTTRGLKVPCSAAELRARRLKHASAPQRVPAGNGSRMVVATTATCWPAVMARTPERIRSMTSVKIAG